MRTTKRSSVADEPQGKPASKLQPVSPGIKLSLQVPTTGHFSFA